MGDSGLADVGLTAALAAHAAGAASRYDVVAATLEARLLVPVVAVLDDAATDDDGLVREKSSHMATVTLVNPDGRRGLLAFSGIAAMQAWRTDARPVPASARQVAQAAIHENADAVLLDVAGPAPFPFEGEALQHLARGVPWLAPHADPRVIDAVARCLESHAEVRSYILGAGVVGGGDLMVEVSLSATTDAAGVLEAVADSIRRNPTLAQRCPEGVALRLGAGSQKLT